MPERDGPPARRAGRLVVLAVALVAVGLVVAVLRRDARERAVGTPARPLVLLLSPDHGRGLSADSRAAIVGILRRDAGLHAEIRVAASPLDGVEAFAGEADAGLLNLFEYILARREYGVEAGLRVLRRGGRDGYTGVIVARADGPIGTIGDLAGQRIAYVDPYSTSGFVFPAKILHDAGVAVAPIFAGSHEKALALLREGGADAAATYAAAVEGAADLRVVARSETIPNEPVFFRSGLRPEVRARLVTALERLAAAPDGAPLLAAVADVEGFHPIDDAAYDEVAAAIRDAGRTVYEVVPEGLRVETRRRGIAYIP